MYRTMDRICYKYIPMIYFLILCGSNHRYENSFEFTSRVEEIFKTALSD
jgi:hypothetical protein